MEHSDSSDTSPCSACDCEDFVGGPSAKFCGRCGHEPDRHGTSLVPRCSECTCQAFVGEDSAPFCGACGHSRGSHLFIDAANRRRFGGGRVDQLPISRRSTIVAGVVIAALIVLVPATTALVQQIRVGKLESTITDDARLAEKAERQQVRIEEETGRVDDEADDLEEQLDDLGEKVDAFRAGAIEAPKKIGKPPASASDCIAYWNSTGRGGMFSAEPGGVNVVFDALAAGPDGSKTGCAVTFNSDAYGDPTYFTCLLGELQYECAMKGSTEMPEWYDGDNAKLDENGKLSQ